MREKRQRKSIGLANRIAMVVCIGDDDSGQFSGASEFIECFRRQPNWIDQEEAGGGFDCGGKKICFHFRVVILPNEEAGVDLIYVGGRRHAVSLSAWSELVSRKWRRPRKLAG